MSTVLYAFATDVASAMPIVIKGAELVLYGSRGHYALNATMYGRNKGGELVSYGSRRRAPDWSSGVFTDGNGAFFSIDNDTGTAAAAEIWAAECGMKPFVRHRGIGVITLGVSVMVFGVVLDIFASRFVKRRKNQQSLSETDTFESEAFLQWRSVYRRGNLKEVKV